MFKIIKKTLLAGLVLGAAVAPIGCNAFNLPSNVLRFASKMPIDKIIGCLSLSTAAWNTKQIFLPSKKVQQERKKIIEALIAPQNIVDVAFGQLGIALEGMILLTRSGIALISGAAAALLLR